MLCIVPGTRDAAALLTMRVQELAPPMRVQDLLRVRVKDLILRRREAPSRRMRPLN
jgi:hypothetical protein